MKKWGIMVLSAFIVFIGISFETNVFGLSSLENCFKDTEAEFLNVTIEGRCMIETSDEPLEVAEKLFKSSRIAGVYKTELNGDTVELNSVFDNCSLKITTKKTGDEKVVYANFALSQHSGLKNINNIRRTIYSAFSAYKARPSFSSLIEGKYKEEMTTEKMKQIASGTLIKNGAAFIDGMDDSNIVSVYGYLPGIKDNVKVLDKDVNLNIALRKSKSDSCTYIWIGSPVISVEY